MSRSDEQAARLRHALRQRGVRKLYSLAVELDVDQSAISRWQRGGTMSLEHAAKLCECLGISLDWLVLGRGQIDAAGSPSESVEMAEVRSLLAALPRPLFDSTLQLLRVLSEQDADM